MITDLCYGILLNNDIFVKSYYANDSGIGKRYYYLTKPIEFMLFMCTSKDIQCDKSYLGQSL